MKEVISSWEVSIVNGEPKHGDLDLNFDWSRQSDAEFQSKLVRMVDSLM